MNERNLNEGQWEDRRQWGLGVRQRIEAFWNRYVCVCVKEEISFCKVNR
jgi:hypothetical protein